jgi:RimJ/RimL family protein N-acetyltransferase
LQTLYTERLIVEPIRAAHADEVWPLLDDDRMWTYYPALRPSTVDQLRLQYERWERGSPASHEIWLNWLCRMREGGAPVGTMQATIRKPDIAYIAYAIFPAHQQKGYATEAVREIIAHARHTYGSKRIQAETDTRNTPSYRLMESLGFKRIEKHKAPDLGQGLAAEEYLYELRV